jgi:AcrR family transcriptional regulator
VSDAFAAERSGGGARTRERIVAAARKHVLLGGEAAASSGRVAADIGMSKALVHYHFADKRELLKAVASTCTEAMRSRPGATAGAPSGGSVIDRCRDWVMQELEARDLETLIQLARSDDAEIAAVAEFGVGEFRSMVASEVRHALATLELRLVIRTDLVADLMATTAIGLASVGRVGQEPGTRTVIDTLWLAILRLTR